MNTSTLIGVALTAAVTFGVINPASANVSSPGEVMSRTVKYGDLNLNNEEGARSLLRRIRTASRYVCTGGDAHWSGSLNTSRAYRTCVRQAQDGAVAQIKSPLVHSLYNGDSNVRMASK